MPKKPRVLTEILYTYVLPSTDKWVRAEAKRQKISRSLLVNHILNFAKSAKLPDVKKSA